MAHPTKHPVAVASEREEAPVQRVENSVPVALWHTRFKLYEEDDKRQCEDTDTCDTAEASPTSDASKRNFAIGHEPIAGAYVVCLPVSDPLATQSLSPTFRDAVFGRTNDAGWILRRAKGALGAEAEVPKAPWEPQQPPSDWKLRSTPSPVFKLSDPKRDRSAFYATTGSTWRIFWTFSQAHFEQFCTELEGNLAAALEAWEVPEYTMEPAPPPQDHEALSFLPAGSLRARYVDYFLLRGNERRYLDTFKKLNPARRQQSHAGSPPTHTAAIFNATPRAFWALYMCEFLQWYTERVIQDDSHWPYLWRLLTIVAAAENDAPIPDLEKALPSGRMGEAAQAMRAYLHDCARSGWRRREEIRTVVEHITVSQSRWRAYADTIEKATGATHPALNERNLDKYLFTPQTVDALIAYFDMYALGFDSQGDNEPVRKHWEHVQEVLGRVRTQQEALIQGIEHLDFLRTLDLCVQRTEDKRSERLALGRRYYYQCACLGIPFWEPSELKLTHAGEWEKYRPFLAWLGEGTDLVEKLFQELLAEYVRVYRLQTKSIETFVDHLFRFHVGLRGSATERTLPKASAVVRLEYDDATGRAVATFKAGPERKVLGEYELLSQVTLADGSPLPGAQTGKQRRQLRRALRQQGKRELKVAHFEVPDAQKLEGFGKLLAQAGAMLRASVVLTSLIEELKQNPPDKVSLDAYLAVAEETLQGLDATSNLVAYAKLTKGASAAEASHPFVRGARKLVRVGDLIEAGRNVVAGSQTVATLLEPHRSTTNLAQYLARGESVAAVLESVKGLVQVGTGVVGVMGACALGAATTTAGISLASWVVVGGSVAIATLDVLVYVKSGGTSPTDGYRKKLTQARAEQFQLNKEGNIKLPDEKAPAAPEDKRHYHPPPEPASALAKHLDGLHALVHAHRNGVRPGRG